MNLYNTNIFPPLSIKVISMGRTTTALVLALSVVLVLVVAVMTGAVGTAAVA